jgi:anthranilate synthase component I
VGAACRATLTEQDGEAVWIGEPPVGVPTSGSPVEALRDTVAALATEPIEGLPPLTGGMVGAIGYDAVRRWERVPDETPDMLGIPEISMMLATDLAVLDHADGSLLLVANAVNYDATDERVEMAWGDAVDRLDRMTADLAQPAESTVAVLDADQLSAALGEVQSNVTEEQFEDMVEEAKEDIRAGEVFQVVLSQRFSTPCRADALDVYRVLRSSNPSPYMYLFRLPTPDGTAFDVVGSSPEALVKVTGRRAITHPIAGSRPRGKTPEEDLSLAEDLLADPKERSEHVMLVDLGRNDVGRVSAVGTVRVTALKTVERYSHVMHLVSEVKGRLADGLGAVDVMRAGFPAGTVSGSPKVRAMEIIDELEPARRGPYAGAVGYFDRGGDMEMCIAIRTLMAHGRRVSVQAGGGLVYDSVPEAEYQETLNKARAVFTAVAQAESRLLDAIAAPPGARIAAARTPPAAQRRPRRRGKR